MSEVAVAPGRLRREGILGDLPRAAWTVLGLVLLADLGLVALFVANELAGLNTELLDLDREANLPAWLGSLQFAGVAVCAALAGLTGPRSRQLAWWLLAAVFVFLSADELATLHEKAAAHVESFWPDGIPKTPVLYSPLIVASLAAVVVIAPEVRRLLGTIRPLVAGFALLAVALTIDAADVQALDVSSPRLRPLIVLEEVTELFGTAILIATALAVFLRLWVVRPLATER